MLVAGYWLRVSGCWILDTGCWMLVTGRGEAASGSPTPQREIPVQRDCWLFAPYILYLTKV
ncbi:MAG: hypothetical protein ISR61_09070 [Desulfobacteraceae bacterium]|uniref:Phosphotransferase n=1 Tax=Candidatus Desulfacyla euxinica TaxID=2841693 RepID=A0A8J6MW93_9DELT|nr:hypothetical protein [Candidatus Desulfacyla euxinica]MBL6979088.1 hypothetical protein [Desulfobacteraceae bacterium]